MPSGAQDTLSCPITVSQNGPLNPDPASQCNSFLPPAALTSFWNLQGPWPDTPEVLSYCMVVCCKLNPEMAPGLRLLPLIHPAVIPSPSPEQSLFESPHPVNGSGGVLVHTLGVRGTLPAQVAACFPIPVVSDRWQPPKLPLLGSFMSSHQT